LGKICFPSSLCSCELIIVIVFGIGNHIMILPLFLFSWQLRRNLSNRFRFVWLILFH
jgi:hypothetical protein